MCSLGSVQRPRITPAWGTHSNSSLASGISRPVGSAAREAVQKPQILSLILPGGWGYQQAFGLRQPRGSWRKLCQATTEGNGATTTVKISTTYSAGFGAAVKVVGASEALGSWNPADAPGMEWGEGDVWSVDLDLPEGSHEFKLVVAGPGPAAHKWEEGQNRLLQVPSGKGEPLHVECAWGQTSEPAPPLEAGDALMAATRGEISLTEAAASVPSEEEENTTVAVEAETPVLESLSPTPEASAPIEDKPPSLQPITESSEDPRLVGLEIDPKLEETPEAGPEPVPKPVPEPTPVSAVAAEPVVPREPDSGGQASRVAEAGSPALEGVVGVLGLFLAPLVAFSEYTLRLTGCGLPPGPGGVLGAAEGVGYLTVVAIVAWSLVTKVRTGRGLPPGPAGLLGTAEGVSYLLLLGGLVIGGLQVAEYGYIPSALPDSRCFGPDAPAPPPLPSIDALTQQLQGAVNAIKQRVSSL